MNHFLAKFKYWIESDWVSFTTKSKTKILFSQNALQICNAWCINISQTSPFCYFGTIFVWRLQYCAAPIHYADNFIWKLAFAFSKVGINLSDVKVLLMEKVEYAKLYFILLTSQDDFVNILSSEKYVEYSERTLIERKWKKMIVCRHTWYSELVGVTSIFFWPGHNYTRERGGHPRYLSSAQETFGLALISGVHTGSSFKICRL